MKVQNNIGMMLLIILTSLGVAATFLFLGFLFGLALSASDPKPFEDDISPEGLGVSAS